MLFYTVLKKIQFIHIFSAISFFIKDRVHGLRNSSHDSVPLKKTFNFNSPHPTLWDEFGRVPEVLLEVGGDLAQTHDAGPSRHTVATQAHINLLEKSEHQPAFDEDSKILLKILTANYQLGTVKKQKKAHKYKYFLQRITKSRPNCERFLALPSPTVSDFT